MKKVQLSLSGIFRLIGAGVTITILVLCIGVFFATQNVTTAIVCLITTAALSIWAFILVKVLQNRLAHFTDDVCQTIDDMMQGETTPRMIFDNDTLLDRINHQLNRLYQMLQANKKIIEEQRADLQGMISDISHQLKTPLAALTMYQEIIAGEPDNPDTIRVFSEKMGISLKRIKQLIEAMLKITRLDAGGIVFEQQKNPVYEVVSHGINELKLRAKQENKEIVLKGDRNQTVSCDLEWTGEAIGNIVKNALDHTDSGGVVHIVWTLSPAMVRIQIKDNGSGISPEDIHHIFKRFYRGKKSLDTQGIGLGLPLAKAIVEGQKGVISVKSELGAGTTFTISFLTDS